MKRGLTPADGLPFPTYSRQALGVRRCQGVQKPIRNHRGVPISEISKPMSTSKAEHQKSSETYRGYGAWCHAARVLAGPARAECVSNAWESYLHHRDDVGKRKPAQMIQVSGFGENGSTIADDDAGWHAVSAMEINRTSYSMMVTRSVKTLPFCVGWRRFMHLRWLKAIPTLRPAISTTNGRN